MTNEVRVARRSKPNVLAILALVVALIALFLPRPGQEGPGVQGPTSALDQIRNSGTLRIGFEGYPPYTVQDPRDLSMSGYSVAMADIIGKHAAWKIDWVKTSPDTKIPDLKAGKFDVMVEPIFATIPRAKVVGFTRPYAYFGYASGIVRKGDDRFSAFESLNQPGIRVAVRQGYTDETYAQDHLPRADIRSMKVDDINQVFLQVMAGNADIALADTSQVKAFYEEHKDQVSMLFVDPPPASVPAGFMLRQGDFAFTNFLNSCIEYLEANGVMDELDKKYGVTALRERKKWR